MIWLLVIHLTGNIGLYKGLGEEPKISKYEDYFVKRSLDSLKPNGILAMVLPSGWLNRQNQLKNAELMKVSASQWCFCRNCHWYGYYYSKKRPSENFHRYFQLF
jgi:hypothetical protein